MFEPWQMREMRPCPRPIREICSCARAAAGLEGAAGAGRGPAQNTLQTTQSQWLRPASIAGQSAHERARSAPRKNWGICAFPRNFRPVGANARNLAARANPRNLGAVSPPYYPPRNNSPRWPAEMRDQTPAARPPRSSASAFASATTPRCEVRL